FRFTTNTVHDAEPRSNPTARRAVAKVGCADLPPSVRDRVGRVVRRARRDGGWPLADHQLLQVSATLAVAGDRRRRHRIEGNRAFCGGIGRSSAAMLMAVARRPRGEPPATLMVRAT